MHVACMKKSLLFLFGLAVLTVAAQAQAGTAPLRIVTSFLPISAATLSIVGDRAEVSQLTGQGVGPHEFEPKPSDLRKIADADLLIVNGLGLEGWLDAVVHKVGDAHLKVVDASAGIAPLENPTELKLSGPSDAKTADGANPHAWLDPVLAKQQAAAILAAVEAADPANAQAYFAKLDQLNADFAAELAKLPSRDLITFHDAFPYFAARYGLNYLGSVEEFPEKAPSPRELGHLVDIINSHHVRIVFAEEGYEPKLLQTIAGQTGAKLAQIDTLEVGPASANGYLERMRSNLAVLQKAWQ